MQRLTTRNSEGIAVLKTPYQCDRCGEDIWRLGDYGNGEPIERLAHYEELQEQGQLLELPCPNWMDIVFGKEEIFWGIDTDYIGIEYPISKITVDNSERISWYDGWKTVILKGTNEEGFDWEFSPEEIGKTVFLTKEEAEAALKKMEGAK